MALAAALAGATVLALGCASASRAGGSRGNRGLAAAIERLLADPSLAGAGAAVLVVSLDRGDTLYAREADRLYTPASNLKLFTAASALHHLGPDSRFRTALVATGTVAADTLSGDLVLVGGGDPDLVTADLAALADSVAGRARVVAGDVRADASLFDDVEWGQGWMWDDGPYWFWPYVSALTVNDNTVSIEVRPGRVAGDAVRVALDPPTAYVEVRTTATTGAAGDSLTLAVDRHWTPKANVVDVHETLPLGVDSVVALRTVEDPPLYAATVLAELLAARGVTVLGEVREGPLGDLESADTLAVHTSGPLAASVENFLKVSDNLTGEMLVKAVGATTAGRPGTYEKGLAATRAFLASEVGIDTLGLRLADGSGVSRYNLVTAGQIVRLLVAMAGREDLAPAWLAALPVAGVDGTLEERMKGTPAGGRARAKTGSLAGVSTLSGYVPSADGERLAFSVLMEFFVGPTGPRRAVQDSIVAALAGSSR